MSKLTINEAVEYLKGVGFKDSAYAPFYPFYEEGSEYKESLDTLVKELQHYKDLEEVLRDTLTEDAANIILSSPKEFKEWLERCSFYVKQVETMQEVGFGYLANWYISSVNENDEPVWTEKHIEELISDFMLIPRDKDTVIIAKWTDEKKCSNCSYTALLDGGEKYVFSRYCPNCGAKMITKEEAEAKLAELKGVEE